MWMVYTTLATISLLTFMLILQDDTASTRHNASIEAVARQMSTYHDAAVSVCGTVCPAGNISAASRLPTLSQNLTDGRFRSISNGSGTVITVFVRGSQYTPYSDGDVVAGMRTAFLKSTVMGAWNASTQRVESAVVGSPGTVISTPVSATFGGYTLHDRQPVIVRAP